MNIVCVSAANIEPARETSASVRACKIIRDLLAARAPQARVEIIPLIDYEMKPCRMCGQCIPAGRCVRDAAFNQVFERLATADGIFFVVPHYAPLPSKLMILFEKMQEIAYLSWCADPEYRFPLHDRPVGVIGHGGQEQNDAVLAYYQRMIVDPVAAALAGVSMRVIGADEARPRGVAFGIRSLIKRPDSLFVDIQHDWDAVRNLVTPLVENVAAAAVR